MGDLYLEILRFWKRIETWISYDLSNLLPNLKADSGSGGPLRRTVINFALLDKKRR